MKKERFLRFSMESLFELGIIRRYRKYSSSLRLGVGGGSRSDSEGREQGPEEMAERPSQAPNGNPHRATMKFGPFTFQCACFA